MPETTAARLDLLSVLFGHRVPSTSDAWRDVLREAADFSVIEGLGARVRATQITVPDDVREVLESAQAESAIHANLALRTAALVCGAASDAAVVKGAALVAWGAIAAGDRYFADVDILVPRAQSVRAADALRAAGYRTTPSLRHDGRLRSPVEWPGANWVSPENAVLDLHVVARPLRDTTWVNTSAGSVRIPSPRALVSGLCRHVEAHHGSTRRGTLRHALDLRAVRDFVGENAWQTLSREPSIARSLVTFGALEHAAERADVAAVDTLLGEATTSALRRLAERSLHRLISIARHDPRQLPWLLVPHPAYVRETTGAKNNVALARAYVARWLGGGRS